MGAESLTAEFNRALRFRWVMDFSNSIFETYSL